MMYNWVVLEKKSAIDFRVRYYKIGNIRGRFLKFEAEIIADENLETSVINLRIRVESISTLNQSWDEKLVSENFLASASYPDVLFHADHGCRLRSGQVRELTGTLQVRAQSRSQTMVVTDASINNKLKIPMASVVLTGNLYLTDFGFNFADGVFGNEVNLKVQFKLLRTPVSNG